MPVHTIAFQRITHRAPTHAAAPRTHPPAAAPGADISASCPCGGACPRCAGPGQRLEGGMQARMQAALGTDLAGVRVHTDPASAEAARRRAANAFTIGQHLFFARGQYAPRTASGQRRIAHELTHVAQQRLGRGSSTEQAAAERESDQTSDAVLAGSQVRPRIHGGGLVQAQASGESPSLLGREQPRRFLSGPEWQLQLDPTIVAQIQLQNYVRWWLGTTLAEGRPPSAPPTPPTPPIPPTPVTPETPDTPVTTSPELPLPSRLWEPIRPQSYADPDVGALLAPYGTRGVPLAARDADAALGIYQRNYAFVQGLPDLRAHAPSLLRPLIPTDWRRRIAGALTSSTVDSALRGQYPTPIEASDRFFENITGVRTTYIPLPGFSF